MVVLLLGVDNSASSSESTFLPETTRIASSSNSTCSSEVQLPLVEHFDEHVDHHSDGQVVHEEVPTFSTPQPFTDIGHLIKTSMTTNEVCSSLRQLSNGEKPFSNWVKISETLSNHSKHQYHRECLQRADILKSTVENPASRIDVMTNTSKQLLMNENKHILRQIVRAILFLSKQGIPLRGKKEDISSGKKPRQLFGFTEGLCSDR